VPLARQEPRGSGFPGGSLGTSETLSLLRSGKLRAAAGEAADPHPAFGHPLPMGEGFPRALALTEKTWQFLLGRARIPPGFSGDSQLVFRERAPLRRRATQRMTHSQSSVPIRVHPRSNCCECPAHECSRASMTNLLRGPQMPLTLLTVLIQKSPSHPPPRHKPQPPNHFRGCTPRAEPKQEFRSNRSNADPDPSFGLAG